VQGNFFGRNGLLDTPGAIDYIRYEARDRLGFHLKEVGGSISGSAVTLPAGDLKLAVGAEYRQEDGFVSPDFLTVSGDSGGNGLDPTRGNFITRSTFWEGTVPVLANLPGIEEFTLEMSGRYTDYSSFGGKYLSRYGFSYAPIVDLRFRGVFATSFRAPGISDLFGGGADSFPALVDPCDGFPNIPDPVTLANCARDLGGQFNAGNQYLQSNTAGGAQLRANIGGNPDLQEETADTYNFGVVYQPSFMPDLSVAVDYFRVEIDQPIVNRDPQRVLDNCYTSVGSLDCGNIQRGSFDGGVNLLKVAKQNVGKIETSGVDFDVAYALEVPVLGATRMTIGGSYTFDFITTDDTGSVKTNGFLNQNDGAIPNFKGRIGARFQPLDDLALSTTARFIGGTKDRTRREAGLPFAKVSDVWYLDTSARYSFSEDYELTFGVRNLMDKRPPFFIDGGTNTNGLTYDLIGRFAFARFTANF